MKPYKKTISENNIGVPWAPLYCYIYAQSLNPVTKVTVQSLDPVSTLRNNCKVTVDYAATPSLIYNLRIGNVLHLAWI